MPIPRSARLLPSNHDLLTRWWSSSLAGDRPWVRFIVGVTVERW
jgi:hypothetical protein